uniref:PORR domain-containing protein n=1 Tax=Haemonchus contortus TaxID=6289 RepID=A0A7I4XXJ8_HAECO
MYSSDKTARDTVFRRFEKILKHYTERSPDIFSNLRKTVSRAVLSLLYIRKDLRASRHRVFDSMRRIWREDVGETARPLKIRLDEHRRALANPAAYPNSSFFRHRTLKHEKENAPSFDVRVLHRYLVRPLERKIMEAREIYRIKPEINAKEEMRDLLRLIE